MRRILIATLAAGALAPAAAADAAGVKTARFVAYVEGKQVTTWTIPRYETYFDCQGQRWTEGSGREVVKWATDPTRILVYKPPVATVPQVKIGTWSMFKPAKHYAIPAGGKLERTGRRVHGIDPSVCHDADGPTVEDTGPYDCGSRPFDPSVTLGWRARRVEIDAIDLVSPGEPFDNCPVEGPLEPDEGGYTPIGQRYPVRDLFDRSQGLVEVLGRKSWTEKIARDHGTATTTTTFKLRLRRAR